MVVLKVTLVKIKNKWNIFLIVIVTLYLTGMDKQEQERHLQWKEKELQMNPFPGKRSE